MFHSSTGKPEEDNLQNGSVHMDIYADKDLFSRSKRHKRLHWSVSWSDLMMTMFILFLVLYVYRAANKEFIFGEQNRAFSSIRESPAAELFKEMKPEPLTENLRVEGATDLSSIDLVKDEAVRIILPGDLLFDSGQAVLKPGAITSLNRIAGIIKKTSYMVNVIGHTDDVPLNSSQYPTNWELSAVRACVVARFLIDETGISGKRFFISGHAYHMPVKANTSSRNRAANRRVEIILTRDKPLSMRSEIETIL